MKIHLLFFFCGRFVACSCCASSSSGYDMYGTYEMGFRRLGQGRLVFAWGGVQPEEVGWDRGPAWA